MTPRSGFGDPHRIMRPLKGQAHEMWRRGNAVAGLGSGQRPVVGTDQVFVGAIHPAHERRGDPALPGTNKNRLGSDREFFPALKIDVSTVAKQCHSLAVDRQVDIVESLSPAGDESHREAVLPVGGEMVQDADAAPGPERGALDPFPLVLRKRRRIRVGLGKQRCILLPDGPSR